MGRPLCLSVFGVVSLPCAHLKWKRKHPAIISIGQTLIFCLSFYLSLSSALSLLRTFMFSCMHLLSHIQLLLYYRLSFALSSLKQMKIPLKCPTFHIGSKLRINHYSGLSLSKEKLICNNSYET